MNLNNIVKGALIAATFAFTSVSWAADIEMNVDGNDLAIKGYDPVAYFTKSAPTKGVSSYTATFKNAIYQFSSAENRDMFKKYPEKYAPQYGGYCAMGVVMDKKLVVEPTAWKIVNDKLYLNSNDMVFKKWASDVSGHILKSERNWAMIKRANASSL
jgi:YHS domain-containing protein